MLITISRQYATNGILIARQIAERLDLHLYDRELVDEVAHQMQLNPTIIPQLYQAASSSVHSLLLEWRMSTSLPQYVRYLRKAVRRIAEEGNAVIVGRGANFLLDDAEALKIRLVAPVELRAAIFRAGNDISEDEAIKIIQQRDRERVNFVKAAFKYDVDDPQHYDLMLNLRCLTPDQATEMILKAIEARRQSCGEAGHEPILPYHYRMMVRMKHHVRSEIVERYR
jgi:cytidylate kinase